MIVSRSLLDAEPDVRVTVDAGGEKFVIVCGIGTPDEEAGAPWQPAVMALDKAAVLAVVQAAWRAGW